MSERDLVCREVVQLLNDYLDGTLTGAQRDEVDRHLEECDGCLAFLQQLQLATRLTATLTEDDVPAPVIDALLGVFRKAH